MRSIHRLVRLIGLVTIFATILQPFAVTQAVAQTPGTLGSVTISLAREGDGVLIGGGCFSVTDAGGNTFTACDDDGDGIVTLTGLAAGDAFVTQTSAPEGYVGGATGSALIVADALVTAVLVNTAVPPVVEPEEPVTEPEEPVVEPEEPKTDSADDPESDEPETDEGAETEDSAKPEQPEAAPQSSEMLAPQSDDRFVRIDCFFDPATNTTDYQVVVAKTSPDAPDEDPELTIVAAPLAEDLSPVDPITYRLYDSGAMFHDSTWRELTVVVTWPDGVDAEAEAACRTSQNETGINTWAFDENDEPIANGGQVPLGMAIRDTSSLIGATINATGTATYHLYHNADCSGAPVYSEEVTVADRHIPNSGLYTPELPGLYNWHVVYSGDALNAPSTSVCGSERVIVGSLQPELTTVMKNAAGDATIPHGGQIPVDTGVYDTAILTGASDAAGGTITYQLYATADCTGPVILSANVDVVNGTADRSDTITLTQPGTYNWVVTYSGDLVNEPAISACGSETLVVAKLNPAARTVMYNADTDSVLNDGANIPVETNVRDSVVLTGVTADAGGAVTFNLYSGTACSGTPVYTSTVNVVNGAAADRSGIVLLTEAGTYNWQAVYSGDARNSGASSPCGNETLIVKKRAPALTTEMYNAADDSVIPNQTVVPLGAAIYDTAELSSATSIPTGAITYRLYKGYVCTGTPLQTYGPFNLVDGEIPAAPAFTPTLTGTYNWQATYSGDAYNNAATSACGTEEFFVEQSAGGVTTRMEGKNNNTIADNADIEFGTKVRDYATLDGVTPDAGGTIRFDLHFSADCGGTIVFTETRNVVNGVVQGPTAFHDFPDMGTYNWHVHYSGDAKNDPVSSECGSETLRVGKKFTSTVTTMHNADTTTVIADNAGLLVPVAVFDTAVINGNKTPDAGGTMTYELYDNANCSGSPIFTSVKTVTNGIAPASDPYTLTDPVVYQWKVTYSGDGFNRTSVSACGQETINGRVQPGITTLIQGIEHGSVIPLDTVVIDTATFTDRFSANAGGTVTYNLYEGDCTGSPFFSSTKTVTNGVIPASNPYTAVNVGTFNWQVVYSGDTHNLPVTSECGLESFHVAGPLTITTTMRRGEQIIDHNGTINVGTNTTDQATLHGTTRDAGGTVTYNLYPNDDCSGAPLFTSTKNVSKGVAPRSDVFKANYIGTFNWEVIYSGDARNPGVISGCGSETFSVTGGVNRQIGITCQLFLSDYTSTFRVTVAKLNPAVPDSDPSLTIVAVPLGLDLSTERAITYHQYDSGTMFTRESWRRLQVEVTWPDGVKGIASAGCNSAKLEPAITTEMVTEGGDVIAQNGQVAPGTKVGDTAVINGGTVSAIGTVTYQLFANDDCTGAPVYQVTRTMTGAIIPDTDFFEVTEGGLYNWVVTYSGDTYNQPATSGCGEERFFVGTNTIEISTMAKDADGNDLPDGSAVTVNSWVGDTVTLAGATDDAGGTVTYNLYLGDCTGTPVFTQTVPVVNGVAEASDLAKLDTVGSYEWQVVYSGDKKNPPAISACGSETVVTEKATPAITTLLSEEIISNGDSVNDTALLTGATDDAGGDVYYYVWNDGDDCTTPIHTFGPFAVVNGVVPNSPSQIFNEPGDYQWGAWYTGDAKNEEAWSVCGSEPLTVLPLEVSITKTADAASVTAGDQIGFTITVTNEGPGIARGVTLADTLPVAAGLAWTLDPAATSDDCAIANGVLSCEARDLGADETITAHITSPTTPASCGVITNTASYGSTNAGTGESTPATVTVLCPDVTLTKEADDTLISAGDEIVFTIVVTNQGQGIARDVTVSDTLPVFAGSSWAIDAEASATGCEIVDGELTCSFGDLAPGATREIRIVSPTTSASCGFIENTAEVASTNEPGTSRGNNRDRDQVQVLCPNLMVTKLASTTTVNAGDPISFRIMVSNIGQGVARDVTLSDPLTWGSNWSVDSDECEIVDGVLTCDFGDIEAAGLRIITVSGTTAAADCGSVSNVVEVAATNEPESSRGDNTDEEFVTILCPDLTVSKQAESSTITAGDTAVFTMVVSNIGQGIARDVTLEDALPAGIDWTVDNTSACEIENDTLSCDFGDLASGRSIEITLSGAVDQTNCGLIENSVTVAAPNEPVSARENNESSDTIAVNCAELIFTKVPDAATVSAGTDIGFTLTITNEGNGEARSNVVLTDTLPVAPGLAWSIDAESIDGACEIVDGVLTCEFGTIAPDATVSVHITSLTTAASCGVISNQAMIEGSNVDDGNASGSVTVLCPNVGIVKTAVNDTVVANDQISFTLTVLNTGLGTATDVVVRDQLPAGIEWSVDDENCEIVDGVLTCSYDEVPSGAEFVITNSGIATPDTCGVIVNNVTISAGNEPEGSRDDNNSTDSVTVTCPDVVVTKVAVEETVTAGDTAEFEIVVTNTGNGTARDAVLTDQLPAGIKWVTTDTVGCEIDDNGLLRCELGDLETGASVTVTITGDVAFENCGPLVNSAEATSTNEPDDRLENNQSEATIIVLCADPTVTKAPDTGTVSAGSDIGFTLTYTNGGDGEARKVTLSDTLPVADGLDWTIDAQSTDGACEIIDGELACEWGTVEAGGSRSVHITSPTTADSCGVVENAVIVTSGNSPTVNDESTVTVLCPDVVIAKVSNGTVVANDEIVWTLTVSNIGEGNATDVEIEDALPAGIAWSVDSPNCAIDPETGVMTCAFDLVESGAGFDILVTGIATPDSCGVIENTAAISAGNEPDDATENNESTATVTVTCPNVAVEKTAVVDTINVGDTAEFAITVSNTGDGIARDVTLEDTLPAGITWSVGDERCEIVDGVLTCDLGDLEPDAEITVLVSGLVSLDQCGDITNTVTVSATNEPDDRRDDNQSTATIRVTCGEVDVIKMGDIWQGEPAPLADACFQLLQDGEPVIDVVCTNSEGYVTFGKVPAGEYELREVSAPVNYLPAADSRPFTVEDGDVITLEVHNELALGTIDLLKVFCVTDGEQRTEFDVTTRREAGADIAGCSIGPGVVFTITGDKLDEPVEITTDERGLATIDLIVGAYTITEKATGDSVEVTIGLNETVVVTVFNYEPRPTGSVNIVKYWCDLPDGTPTMHVDGTPNLDGCTPGSASFLIDDGYAFNVGDDGTAEITLPEGSYTLTEPCASLSASFAIVPEGATTVYILNDVNGDCGNPTNPTTPQKPKPNPNPTPDKGPVDVKEMPNTGSGPAAGGNTSLRLITGLLALALLGGLITLLTGRKPRATRS